MKVSLFALDKFVAANELQEVTNPVMLDKGNIPTMDGLLSTAIFGTTIKDRSETWAYINLGQQYINPLVYITLKKLDRRFGAIVSGAKKYILNGKGELVEDEENGDTGLTFIYKNWEKFNWTRHDGSDIPNSDLWKKLWELIKQLNSDGVDFDIQWVPAGTLTILKIKICLSI